MYGWMDGGVEGGREGRTERGRKEGRKGGRKEGRKEENTSVPIPKLLQLEAVAASTSTHVRTELVLTTGELSPRQ